MMITPQDFSLVADRAAERYSILSMAMKAAYDEAILQKDAFTPRGRIRFIADITSLAKNHSIKESNEVSEEISNFSISAAEDAYESLGKEDDFEDALLGDTESHDVSNAEHLQSEIDAQLLKDVKSFTHAYGTLGFTVKRISMAQRIKASSVLVNMDKLRKPPKSAYVDSRGKRWPAPKYIRTIWRRTLINVYNSSFMYTLAYNGEGEAVIWHPNPDHRAFGAIISMTEEEGLSYSDYSNDVFHPNTDALVRSVKWFRERYE